ncbi:hypothetical protein A2291_07075 [candidate division WOR-1 bacterium RIFOXYB2_FULL_42_35]|uniref:Peptidase M50 domain-containing protein n=1 Tax=candidate division WOR-1 bacterium RIFOXYC2_FULL_41_25 TaxID=1802586 RepID=A0A1F4TKF4_UNCSA|nr:MAG: hypothetical protein A2247_04415 [candidate division WOR-1 bacterium RIFOXYA2_FULL_41_14]OGC22470.1 MAG: hypothetical protein A2291_07075 [candidate division WOR-1 bacterium RIFOXYB2_FULL_42_35]OGC33208.1 MAG: hypothetical protein A2462_07250 [candidate division WOR-1 bacterium RIFOXYC2_FULL_41_25]OGC41920.1 MAG: hypothetical protein A2548_03890 [candidate division WOR-1 bacterium RIFOXYD2_FULL_41_8]
MILYYILIAVIVLYSIIAHEVAHGKVAEMMGDQSARMYGRITLNPIPHIDPIGTLLPVVLIVFGSPIIFGWAKPVPINPYNFRDYKKAMIYVSAAGIVTNLFMAWTLATIVKFLPLDSNYYVSVLSYALIFGVRINIVLAIFNLLPIPPLDGSKLFSMLLPSEYSQYIYKMEPYGMMIVFLFLMFPPTQTLLWGIIDFIYGLMMFKLF